jgi:hypothetical protein
MTKRKNSEDKLKVGAPPLFPYSKERGERVCFLISTHPGSLDKLKEIHPEIPNRNIIFEWRYKHPEFNELYLAAKQNQVDLYVEETFDLADRAFESSESIAKANMQINLRKWYASRLCPRIWGDKLTTDSTVVTISHEEALKKLK